MMRINGAGGEKTGGVEKSSLCARRRDALTLSATVFFTRWLEAEGHRRDSVCRLNTMVTVYPHLRNALRERDNAVWRFSRLWFVARETRKEKLQGGSLPVSLPLFEREISRVSVFRPVPPFAASSLSLSLSCFHVVTRIFAFQGPRERERERRDLSASS